MTAMNCELTGNMIFQSYPVLTDPGGLLQAISGKTEKKTHDQTLKEMFVMKSSLLTTS